MIQGIIFQICIIKVVLDITEHNTVDWRRQNNISDSDGIQSGWTRIRCDTVSTAHSDSHDRKRKRLEENIFYHNSLCSRVQGISRNFSNLNILCSDHCGHWPMFGGKISEKTLNTLRHCLADDFVQNMIKQLNIYLQWFSAKQ